MAQKIERTRAEPRFVEIANVDAEIERTTAQFQALIVKFKQDTQKVLEDFDRKIKGEVTKPAPSSAVLPTDDVQQFRQLSVARDSTRPEELEAFFKTNSSSRESSPASSRSASLNRDDSEERAPLGLETSNPSESDEERDERLAQSLAKLRVSDSEGGNGSNSHTKKRKNNFKKPWPTRSSRKPNGKGRKTRSRPRN